VRAEEEEKVPNCGEGVRTVHRNLEEPFMKLKLVAAIFALAIPALAHAQQSSPQPNVSKPTKADAQNVVQIVTSDKVKTQAYCDLGKVFDQIQVAKEKNDSNTIQALGKQLLPLVDKLGPEYVKVIEGMGQVDLTSSEGEELLSILSELDKRCTK
jgi:hypothetical protein